MVHEVPGGGVLHPEHVEDDVVAEGGDAGVEHLQVLGREGPGDAGEEAEVAALVKAEMEGAATLDVPLVVDLAFGSNWRDMQ